MRLRTLCLMGLALVACGPKKAPSPPIPVPGLVDAAAVVAEFRAAPAPGPLRARAKLRISSPSRNVTTPAALLLDGPDRLRLDVLTPIGSTFAIFATDGEAMHAWLQKDATFLRGDDAVAVLGRATGGVIGVPDLLDLLTGRLPVDDATVLHATPHKTGVEVILGRPTIPDYRLRAMLDPQADLVRELAVHQVTGPEPTALGDVLVRVTYPGERAAGEGTWRPDDVVVELPSLGWTVTLDVTQWEELAEAPDVFTLEPVSGATERDLLQVLDQLTTQAGVQPPG